MIKRVAAWAVFIATLSVGSAFAQDVTLLGGSATGGFPITLGSTSIAAGSTTTAVTGLSVNGVTLAGSGTLNIGPAGTLGTAAFQNTGTSGANVPLLNGANTFSGTTTVSSASFGLSGNFSAPAWATAGIRYANTAATITDTTSSGTVAAAYTDLFGGNTIAASNATTFTNYYAAYIKAPVTGTNVTMTNKYALGVDSLLSPGDIFGNTLNTGTNASAKFTVGGNLSGGVDTYSNGRFAFTNSASSAYATADVILNRDAAGILAQRNAANAQTLRVYNTFTDVSNYERGIFDWQGVSNVLTVGTEAAGTGSVRGVNIAVGPSNLYTFRSANLTMPGGLVAAAASTISYSTRTILASPSDGILELTNNAVTDFGRLQLGGTTSSFPAIKRSSAALAFRLADDSADAAITSAAVTSSATVKTGGYAIASLPAGTAGMRAYVTDQLTTCAAAGVALTAGGSAVCPVFYNGTIWTGD